MGSWGEQFSVGDQGINKRQFWRDDFHKCPFCTMDNFTQVSTVAGCRHNGDGYGTAVFTCNSCGWCTSFHYDESSTPVFYEMRGVNPDKNYVEPLPEPTPPRKLGTYIKTRYQALRVAEGDEACRAMMIRDFYSEEVIADFFGTKAMNKMAEARRIAEKAKV